jgi:hypothetical protein
MVRSGGEDFVDRARYMPSWSADEISNAEVELVFEQLAP